MASGVSTLSEGCKTCSTLISDPLLPNSAPRNTVKPKLFCFHIRIHPCLNFLPTYEPHHSRWVAGTMREGLTKNPSRKCHRIHLWWTQTTLFWLGKKHVFSKAIFRDWETLTFHTGFPHFRHSCNRDRRKALWQKQHDFTCAVLSRCPRNRCSCNDLSMTYGMKRK